ncbi:hypothetical protein D3C86_1413910 [compost metagenome]
MFGSIPAPSQLVQITHGHSHILNRQSECSAHAAVVLLELPEVKQGQRLNYLLDLELASQVRVLMFGLPTFCVLPTGAHMVRSSGGVLAFFSQRCHERCFFRGAWKRTVSLLTLLDGFGICGSQTSKFRLQFMGGCHTSRCIANVFAHALDASGCIICRFFHYGLVKSDGKGAPSLLMPLAFANRQRSCTNCGPRRGRSTDRSCPRAQSRPLPIGQGRPAAKRNEQNQGSKRQTNCDFWPSPTLEEFVQFGRERVKTQDHFLSFVCSPSGPSV